MMMMTNDYDGMDKKAWNFFNRGGQKEGQQRAEVVEGIQG